MSKPAITTTNRSVPAMEKLRPFPREMLALPAFAAVIAAGRNAPTIITITPSTIVFNGTKARNAMMPTTPANSMLPLPVHPVSRSEPASMGAAFDNTRHAGAPVKRCCWLVMALMLRTRLAEAHPSLFIFASSAPSQGVLMLGRSSRPSIPGASGRWASLRKTPAGGPHRSSTRLSPPAVLPSLPSKSASGASAWPEWETVTAGRSEARCFSPGAHDSLSDGFEAISVCGERPGRAPLWCPRPCRCPP